MSWQVVNLHIGGNPSTLYMSGRSAPTALEQEHDIVLLKMEVGG